jgi:hypothetical protein
MRGYTTRERLEIYGRRRGLPGHRGVDCRAGCYFSIGAVKRVRQPLFCKRPRPRVDDRRALVLPTLGCDGCLGLRLTLSFAN